MARYIDLEEFAKRINDNIKADPMDDISESALIEWCKDECIRQGYAMPVADVVPKSKYDLAVAEREANVKGFTEELAKVKAEVIREIFEEIDELIFQHGRGDLADKYFYLAMDELKKKYTEIES